MTTDDGLFPATEAKPAHPDQQVAYEEIDRYYSDRVAEARAALAKAQTNLDRWLGDEAIWRERRKITPDVVGSTDLAPRAIIAASNSRYHEAASLVLAQMGTVGGRVVNRAPNSQQLVAEAERLGERETALRRWLTANGHDLGALAEPPPNDGRQRRRRT